MAKRRRPSKSSKSRPKPVTASASRSQTRSRPAELSPSGPQRRTTYIEAVALYERGLDTLQRHDYEKAGQLFEGVLRQYPEEKELHERVRLYLNICQRHASQRAAIPQTIEERLFASTIAINGGRYDEAILQLHLVRDEDPDNDHALYMLAIAHAQRGEHTEAVAHLERAIAVNPENRGFARTDPDLEPLRGDESFRAAIESTSSRSGERRRPLKTRTGR